MHRILAQVADRVLAAAPGWMLLAAGLTLVAAVVLTPAWLANDRLAWERDVLAAQTDHLHQQADRYDRLYVALNREDPILLERLAFTELGLKPRGETPLMPLPDRPRPGSDHRLASTGAPSTARQHWAERTMPWPGDIQPVTQWPVQPLPRVGRGLPEYRPPNTRLTRLATGESRYALLGAAAACILAGCWPGLWGNGSAREADAE